jgi:hypothetical protein
MAAWSCGKGIKKRETLILPFFITIIELDLKKLSKQIAAV